MMYTKKLLFDAENDLPLSDFGYDQYPLRRARQRTKNADFCHVVARHAMRIGRMANRVPGGDYTYDFEVFSYTSLCSVINS